MAKETVLQITNLTKTYGSRMAVSNVNLEVFSGEIFGFLGPNGAGKTTLIKVITGLAKADRGEVKICGFDLKKDFSKAIKNVGAIVESPDMYSHLTGYENLKYYASFYEGIDDEQIRQTIDLVGMSSRAYEKISRYSLGMKQRLGIAQALLHNPKLLILDEPTNGLDPTGIKEIRDLFKMLAKKRDITVFVSSHILSEMQLMCDRVGIINKGALITVQSMEELAHSAQNAEIPVIIDTQKAAEASNVINKNLGIDSEINDYGIKVKIKRNEIAKLNQLLVENKIPVSGLHGVEKTLEDMYIELIGSGGDSIV